SPDLQQELCRLGPHLRGDDDRHCHSGPAAAPLDHHQHPRRELPAQRTEAIGTALSRAARTARKGGSQGRNRNALNAPKWGVFIPPFWGIFTAPLTLHPIHCYPTTWLP